MPSTDSIGVIWTGTEFCRQDLVQTTDPFLAEIYKVVVLSKMKHESERTFSYHMFILLLSVRNGTRALTEQYVD
jgi:hypothetical protein